MVGRGTAVLGLTEAPTKAPAPDTARENLALLTAVALKHKNINKINRIFLLRTWLEGAQRC